MRGSVQKNRQETKTIFLIQAFVTRAVWREGGGGGESADSSRFDIIFCQIHEVANTETLYPHVSDCNVSQCFAVWLYIDFDCLLICRSLTA